MDSNTSIILALVAIISTIVAFVTTANTRLQGEVIKTLREQVTAGTNRESERVAICETRNDHLLADQRTNTESVNKLVGAVDKLAGEQTRTTQLLGDLVYGREQPRRP